ncbi:MAG: TonB-dependent receptor [Halieaceae bacterium]|nr:TonB-dependent receptor [Halieaceae bacterium]
MLNTKHKALVGALTLALATPAALAQMLEEVVVTAQKREQTLKDVPISISAITGERLQNRSIDNMNDLSTSIPNFFVAEAQIDSNIGIRGVQTGSNKGFEQSVAMYFDGISYGRSQLIRTPLVDLERAEVLRGPQPTLFGKNAIAGAVNITSAKPTDEFEGKVSVSYESEHSEKQALLVLSGPLSDTLKGRITASWRDIDGWIENELLKRKEPSREEDYLRAQLTWDASDKLSVNFKAESANFDKYGYAMEAMAPQDAYSLVFAGPIAVETDENWVRASGDVESLNEMTNFVITADYDLGDLTLTSVTGYVDYDTKETLDVDYTILEILDRTNQTESYSQFSQELRIASPGGEKIDYIGGVFYQTADVDVTDQVYLGSFLAAAGLGAMVDSYWDRVYTQSSDLWSAFLQADINLNEKTVLTVGARYSSEDKDGARAVSIEALPTNTTPAGTLAVLWGAVLNTGAHSIDGKRSENSFDPLVRLSYDLNDNISTYVSYTQGSKAGGFDIRGNSIPGTPGVAVPGTFEFEGEEADNIELGVKMRWDRAELNATYFTTEYANLQTNIFDGTLSFLVQNASAADVEGFEIDGRYLLAEGIELYASAASLDYKYTDFKDSQCGYGEAPTNGIFCDRSGFTAPFAPETTANAGIDYSTSLGNGLVLDANVNVDYSSEYFLSSNLDANLIENGYTKYAAQIGLGSEDGKWRVSIIGENLGDERIRLVGGTLPLSRTVIRGAGLDGIGYDAIYARPRNVALKLDYNF